MASVLNSPRLMMLLIADLNDRVSIPVDSKGTSIFDLISAAICCGEVIIPVFQIPASQDPSEIKNPGNAWPDTRKRTGSTSILSMQDANRQANSMQLPALFWIISLGSRIVCVQPTLKKVGGQFVYESPYVFCRVKYMASICCMTSLGDW